MEKNLSSVKPSDSFSDEDIYTVSSTYASTDSDTDTDASEFIIKPSVAPPASVIKPDALSHPRHRNSSNSDEEESDSDLKLSVTAAVARGGQKKGNGGPGKPRSKADASDPATPAGSNGRKRAAEGSVAEAKRPNKNSGPEGSERKPGDMFKRIFSENDEIALLKGMIRYESEKQSDPFADVSAFHEFVKPGLESDPKVDQLLLKMRKLKTKYDKNKRKEESGIARNLKAHERRAYELSKLVNWNEGRRGGRSVKSPKPVTKRTVAKKAPVETVAKKAPVEKADVGGNDKIVNAEALNGADIVGWNNLSMDKIGAQLFEGENRAAGAAEWRNLQMKEMELHWKMLEVMCAKSKLVSSALKTGNYNP